MKIWKKIIIVLLVLFISAELYLRLYWGFCDSVLMMGSKNYEYIAQPNQDRFRFRKHVKYNSFSMRSEEVDTTSSIILGLGDSILNGGVSVDQDSIATTLLSDTLTKINHSKVQVLNISAGSWGPDNCFAYLKEKGYFKAKMIFLVVSSHDAYDNMDFMPVIDKVRRYESKQYKLATWELIDKYLIPILTDNFPSEQFGVIKHGLQFNNGFENLYQYCKSKNIPFIIYLNPDRNEIADGKYNVQGDEIIAFCKSHAIDCIQGLNHTIISDYRGVIHLNASGQKKMSALLLNGIFKKNNQYHFIKLTNEHE